MSKAAATKIDDGLSHNLLGQRLGRKGRGTRERIIAAAERVIADPSAQFSLSAVAREASLGMTTLYLYFSDLIELVLAVLERIMASAEDLYVARLRARWDDGDLVAQAQGFVAAYHRFWDQHSRVLHLRNSYGMALDARLSRHRLETGLPVIRLLAAQMDADPDDRTDWRIGLATVLLTGTERVVTVITDPDYTAGEAGGEVRADVIGSQAHVLALAIRDARDRADTPPAEVRQR